MSAATMDERDNELSLLFQYTVEAYKIFQKLAETLRNPMSAQMFAKFAAEEREHRDLIEIKHSSGNTRMSATLAGDSRFIDTIDSDLAPAALLESLILRERTMAMRMSENAKTSRDDKALLTYIAGTKKSHVVLLERELELLKVHPEWFKREDAESLLVGETLR